jgi:very-short-patch-repair endonuclease
MSLPEAQLWQVLRKRPDGFKFRRQHPLGRYVLDFYCASAKLAVEVDGAAHGMGRNPARDEHRDRWVLEQGIRTLRFGASDVLKNIDALVRIILAECSASLPLHHPSGGPPPQA